MRVLSKIYHLECSGVSAIDRVLERIDVGYDDDMEEQQ